MGDALQKRMAELAARQQAIRPRLAEIAEGATLRAIEEAADHTPPNTCGDGETRGVHMITGELAQHWSSDSQSAPVQSGGRFTTLLANEKQYASYVNDGHRLDRHFVPGLYVDDSGLLSRDPARRTGLMVGVRTRYVPGLYMKEKAVDKYQEIAEAELGRLSEEVFR